MNRVPLADLLESSKRVTPLDRVMVDSNRPELLLAHKADLYATYVDGDFAASHAELAALPDHRRVLITVEPWLPGGQPSGYPFGDFHHASVIDVETGAWTIGAARRFVTARNGYRPGTGTVYIEESRLDQLLRGLRGRAYWLWLAWYLDREPTAEEITEIQERIAPYGVRLAAWQHTPGPEVDRSLVVAADWHRAPR